MVTTGNIRRSDMDPVIQHFSHLHPLKLLNFGPQTTNAFLCAGCKLEASGCFYFCSTCNYCLHKTCAGMPRNREHQVDPNHTLVLLSTPIYATRSFKCNACGKLGTGFCYHCKDCQLDIHTLCIYKPSSVNTSTHRHTLELCFSPPYSKKKFQCDICKQFGSNHWLYRCGSCNYDVHMNCAISNRLRPATEIQQTKQQILCPADIANTQFQSVRAIQTHQTRQKQLLCLGNGPHSQLQSVIGVQQGQKQKLHHSNNVNIHIETIRAIQVHQTHQEQLLCHNDKANAYAQPVSSIQQPKQQPQLLKSRSFPPRFPKFMTDDLPNSGSTFQQFSQPIVPIPEQQISVRHVQTPNPIPQPGSSNWNQPCEVYGYKASLPTLPARQHFPQPTHQMHGYTASTPIIAAVPQNVQPPNTTKPANNLMDRVVQDLVDGFIEQAGGSTFDSLTSGDFPFDLNIGN